MVYERIAIFISLQRCDKMLFFVPNVFYNVSKYYEKIIFIRRMSTHPLKLKMCLRILHAYNTQQIYALWLHMRYYRSRKYNYFLTIVYIIIIFTFLRKYIIIIHYQY